MSNELFQEKVKICTKKLCRHERSLLHMHSHVEILNKPRGAAITAGDFIQIQAVRPITILFSTIHQN